MRWFYSCHMILLQLEAAVTKNESCIERLRWPLILLYRCFHSVIILISATPRLNPLPTKLTDSVLVNRVSLTVADFLLVYHWAPGACVNQQEVVVRRQMSSSPPPPLSLSWPRRPVQIHTSHVYHPLQTAWSGWSLCFSISLPSQTFWKHPVSPSFPQEVKCHCGLPPSPTLTPVLQQLYKLLGDLLRE